MVFNKYTNGEHIYLYFFETDEYDLVENDLIQRHQPPYNEPVTEPIKASEMPKGFDMIWEKIKKNEGQEFKTITGLPFTYEIIDDKVVPDRTGYPLAKVNFEEAAKIEVLSGPGKLPKNVFGPSYVYAILQDKRIR